MRRRVIVMIVVMIVVYEALEERCLVALRVRKDALRTT